MKPIRVFVCEDQPVVLEGLKRVLENASGIEFVGASETLPGAIAGWEQTGADILLVDQEAVQHPLTHVLGQIRQRGKWARVVIWAQALGHQERRRLLEEGAQGIVRKQSPCTDLLACLSAVWEGRTWVDGAEPSPAPGAGAGDRKPRLTPREADVLRLVSEGLTNREIAARLRIAQGTVKVHLMHLFEKTGVRGRAELAKLAAGLLAPEAEQHPSRPSLAVAPA